MEVMNIKKKTHIFSTSVGFKHKLPLKIHNLVPKHDLSMFYQNNEEMLEEGQICSKSTQSNFYKVVFLCTRQLQIKNFPYCLFIDYQTNEIKQF